LKQIVFVASLALLMLTAPACATWKEDLRKCQIGSTYEKDAIKSCRKVIEDFKNRPDKQKEVAIAWDALASDANFVEKNIGQAAEYYSNSILADGGKHFPRVFNYRGDVYRKLGRYDKAIADFEHLIKTMPTDSIYGEPYDKQEAWAYLGRVYYEKKDHKQAADNLAKGYFAVRNNIDFKEILKFYGFDNEKNVKAYKNGKYTPPQLASSKPVAQSQGSRRGSSRVSSSHAPLNDGLYRSSDPNFSMGDPSLDF